MAKIKSNSTSKISGRIGGIVHVNGANGSYIRKYTYKSGRFNSSHVYLDLLADLNRMWRSLSDDEKASWERGTFLFPKIRRGVGQIRTTKKNLFCSHSHALITYCGYNLTSIPKICPPWSRVIGVSTIFPDNVSVGLQKFALSITFLNGNRMIPADHRLVVKASQPMLARDDDQDPSKPTILRTYDAFIPTISLDIWSALIASGRELYIGSSIKIEVLTVNTLTGETTFSKSRRFRLFI